VKNKRELSHLLFILIIMACGAIFYYSDQIPFVHALLPWLPPDLARYSIYRILSIIPVAYAAIIFHFRGGLISALLITFSLLPRAVLISSQKVEAVSETIAFLLIGLLISWLIDRQSRAIRRLDSTQQDLRLSLEQVENQQRQVQLSEDRYRNLFNSANDSIYVRDLEGNIIMTNPAMAALTGYTVDELVEMNISQLLSESSLETTMEQQRMQLENTDEFITQRDELQLIKKDGTERIIEVVNSLIDGGQDSPSIQTIARDVTEQKRAHDGMRTYAHQVIEAQEEERKRVARELHDETAQALVSLGMDINSLIRAKQGLPEDIMDRLKELRNRTDDILTGVRSLSQALRPSMLEELGLLEALRWLTKDLTNQYGINANFDIYGTPRRLPPESETALFRIIQEALKNIGKHSQATQAAVRIQFYSDRMKIDIVDNGQGFNVPDSIEDYTESGRLGLMGMQERADLINGTLTVYSSPGQGTILKLEIMQ
jgi:two-component system sensor histidine kinase DegS